MVRTLQHICLVAYSTGPNINTFKDIKAESTKWSVFASNSFTAPRHLRYNAFYKHLFHISCAFFTNTRTHTRTHIHTLLTFTLHTLLPCSLHVKVYVYKKCFWKVGVKHVWNVNAESVFLSIECETLSLSQSFSQIHTFLSTHSDIHRHSPTHLHTLTHSFTHKLTNTPRTHDLTQTRKLIFYNHTQKFTLKQL